ncbi:MAG: type I-MYXAN CRISPR-associated protein Cas6/Cmx6 [Gammaproteobacteria bacterium]|nr:MAG: type I-MYXAN CRISPR-associated protein Cas6/Cmx6 [Gammaproteobacteria bacterium]
MFWQEDGKKDDISTSDKVVDLHYKIECKQIPTCHAWELSQALYRALPWIKDETEVGIHQIHGATSGNGWERPPDGELIHLSKRTRMHLRVPTSRISEANALVGKTLDVAGHPVTVGKMTSKQIDPFSTIFARYIVISPGMNEDDFLLWVFDELKARDIQARKLLCGIGHEIEANGEKIETRSLMIADLDMTASVALQEVGIGPHRHLGCGIFIAHKGIKAVGETEDKSHFTGS